MVKFTILLTRKASMTHEAFVDHHRNVHASLFMSVPVGKDVQQHAIAATLPGMPPTKYDGITELWFDDLDALARCFSDPEYLEKIRPDEDTFLDLHSCDFVVSSETMVA